MTKVRIGKIKKFLLSKSLRLILGLVLICYIIFFLFRNKNLLANIFSISPFFLVLLIFSWLLLNVLTGYKIKILTLIFKVKTEFREWFGLTVISTMSGYLLPQSGFVTKAGYFRFHKKMPITNFLAVQGADLSVLMVTKGLLGLAIIFFLPIDKTSKLVIALIFLAIIILGFLPFLIKESKIRFKKIWIIDKIKNLIVGIQLINKTPAIWTKLILINISISFINAFWYFFAFQALGIRVSFFYVLILGLLISMMSIFQITPGNLGVQEIVIATYSEIGHIGFDQGLAVSLLLRGISIILSFSLGLIFARKILKIRLT